MNSLDQLRAELGQANTRLWREGFGSTKPMAELAAKVEQRFGGGVAPEKDVIAEAVRQFSRSRQAESFRDVKLACYGIAIEVLPERILLLRDPHLVGELLHTVEGLRSQARKFRRCFQALMTAYFEYQPEAKPDSSDGTHQSWQEIRRFLKAGLPSIRHEPMPEWAEKVVEHSNLFEDDPCVRYGEAVLEGSLPHVRDEFTRIGIATNSWIQRDVFVAAVRAACNSNDQQFKVHIESLLDLLRANPAIQVRGVKKILDRYARMDSHGEHTALRVFSTDLLGNPLLLSNAPRWEGVSSEARKMVSDWLKLKLIEQFFELLSHDGATDTRRVRFWAQYVPAIENIWFVLGSSARSNWNPDFKKLRGLMADQALVLEGATSGNNAFVMKVGQLLIVEFGETGNAAYLFDSRNPPFTFRGALHLRNDLKNGRNLGSLKHLDGHEKWEQKFRREIKEHTGIMSGSAWQSSGSTKASDGMWTTSVHPSGGVFTPSNFEQSFRRFCAERGLRFIDQRAEGGKLVVYADAGNPKISGTLGQWGFRFDSHNGVWTKNK